MHRMRTHTVVLGLIVMLVSASAASAQVRHAAPNGTSGGCTALTPCGLVEAINDAADGDEVVVAPGAYTAPSNLNGFTPHRLSIHGVPGQPRPSINSIANGSSATLFLPAGSSLAHVSITAGGTAGSVIFASGAVTIDGVEVRNVNGALTILSGVGAVVRNSLFASTGNGAVSVLVVDSPNVRFSHVTAVSRGAGGSRALESQVSGTNTTAIAIDNSILRGDLDLTVLQPVGASNSVTLTHSAYRFATAVSGAEFVTVGPGPLAADPVFVNPAAGDFHQAPTSPTIDAGDVSTIPVDIDGQPRSIGAAPDIGADEFAVSATASTGPATGVGTTTATLTGTLNPNGLRTTFAFEYGPTTGYGQSAAGATPLGGVLPETVSANLAGLTPATTYHARLVATNALGRVEGPDVTFTTVTPPDTAAPGLGILRLTKAPIKAGTATALRFQLTEAARVRVVIERLVPGRTVGTKCVPSARTGRPCTKATKVATITRSLAAGTTATFAIPARPAGRRLAPGRYRLTVQASDAAGNTSRTRTITLVVTAS